MMFSRRPACWPARRSRSPGSRSATPRRWSPNSRSEHDREASSRPSRVHVCGRFGSDRPARAGYRLHPGGGGMWAQGEQQGEQWHGIAQDRDEHEVRGPTHQGVQGSRARPDAGRRGRRPRSEEHTSELQSRLHLVCRLLLEKKKKKKDKLVITPIRKEHNILVLRHTTTHYQLN